MVASKKLRLAVEVDHGDGRRMKSKNGEDGSNDTAQVGPGDRVAKCEWI